ncbi:MAG: Holliday junction resolvase RuvX [Pseudomonadota bacterium]
MPDKGSPASLIAFDFGNRRIGVAVGQTLTASARELTTLQSVDGEPDWAEIDSIIDDWGPDLLLVGLPVNDDGTESTQCEAARDFAAALGEYGLPVQLIDEHLTSNEAARRLADDRRQGKRRRRVQKGDIDALSAVLIAEQWLYQRDISRQS